MGSDNKGILIVISGPSGVGKGTLVKKLLKEVNNIYLSVSVTTRKPRRGEVDGKHYKFIAYDEFIDMVKNDGFLEYAKYNSNYYGTPKKEVSDMLNKGNNIILEIDVQGAFRVKDKYKEAQTIFIMPPCVEDLYKRLRSRNTETKEEIEKRVTIAKEEINLAKEYDYVVVNDSVKSAVNKIKCILEEIQHITV